MIIPAVNEAASLPRLLEALLRGAPSGDRPDEVFVVDGGSSDGTPALAAERGARLLCAERGRGLQMAAGARAARSDVFLFLHADSCPEPGALAALRSAFRDPALVATGMRQRVEGRGLFYRLVEWMADFRVRRQGIVYGDSGLGARREAYFAVGGFADLPLFEDVDLSRRLREHGPVRWVPGAGLRISPRRWQAEGALRRTVKNWMLRMAYAVGADPVRLARFYAPHDAPAAQRAEPS